jgi:hypothetical protein
MAYHRTWSTSIEGFTVSHTYGVVEESGQWYISVDGEPTRNVSYHTTKAARLVIAELTRASNLWEGIFDIENRIAEAFKDTPWPYGATCVNHGTSSDPEWILTEPYRSGDEAVRTINPDPTGNIQINVYTRDLYESACQIVGIEPETDDTIVEQICDCGHSNPIPRDISPIDAVRMRLAYRRSIGVGVEKMLDQNQRVDRLEAAGLMLDSFTRDQYTAACDIIGVPALPDDKVLLLVWTLDVASDMGVKIVAPDVPHNLATINLAYRRVLGIRSDVTDEDTTDDARDDT